MGETAVSTLTNIDADVVGAIVSVQITREDWARGGSEILTAKINNAAKAVQRVLEEDIHTRGWVKQQ